MERERSQFTVEQVQQLGASPYVAKVTRKSVRFTEEFKRIVYDRIHSGETTEEVFKSLGIDPEVLGENRIRGFEQNLERMSTRETGFTDQRCKNGRQPGVPAKSDDAWSMEDLPIGAQRRIERLEGEVEFLKKNWVAKERAIGMTRKRRRQNGSS